MKIRSFLPLLILIFVIMATGCTVSESTETPEATTLLDNIVTMDLTSKAFLYGNPIPAKYTCDEEEISPPLEWSEIPEGTQSFLLIADDPDAAKGTWNHWIVFNIPKETTALAEDFSKTEPSDDTQFGENSWGRKDYGGPCPPGGTHRYFFKLYALDTLLDLNAGATREELVEAMNGHILGEGELMGTYQRT